MVTEWKKTNFGVSAYAKYALLKLHNWLIFLLYRVSFEGQEVMNVAPPPEGFWKLGELDKTHINNPYKYTTNKMAPFDQEVGFASFQLMLRDISYKAEFFL